MTGVCIGLIEFGHQRMLTRHAAKDSAFDYRQLLSA